MTVALVRTEWSGTSGGPGLTQLAVLGSAGGDWNPEGAQSAVNAVRTFWDSIKAYLPDELKLTVSPVVDTYNRATGDLLSSSVAAVAPSSVLGTATTGYAAGAGFKITWNTGQIANGRRVRGSTFIVPAGQSVYTATGTINGTIAGTVNTACAALISSLAQGGTSLAVWSRPRDIPTPRVGFATQVATGLCSSKTAILRGRRD